MRCSVKRDSLLDNPGPKATTITFGAPDKVIPRSTSGHRVTIRRSRTIDISISVREPFDHRCIRAFSMDCEFLPGTWQLTRPSNLGRPKSRASGLLSLERYRGLFNQMEYQVGLSAHLLS